MDDIGFDFFEKVAEQTSPAFVEHIKGDLMGAEYNSAIAKYEVTRDSDKMYTVRVLEHWESTTPYSGEPYIAHTVLVFNFFKKRGSCRTEFREMVNVIKEYLEWANVSE